MRFDLGKNATKKCELKKPAQAGFFMV